MNKLHAIKRFIPNKASSTEFLRVGPFGIKFPQGIGFTVRLSVLALNFINHNLSGGTSEPQTTNNYPKILQSKFLSSLACMIFIVLGGLLEMVAVKTILLLNKTQKLLITLGIDPILQMG